MKRPFLLFLLFTISACANLPAQTFSLITGRLPCFLLRFLPVTSYAPTEMLDSGCCCRYLLGSEDLFRLAVGVLSVSIVCSRGPDGCYLLCLRSVV